MPCSFQAAGVSRQDVKPQFVTSRPPTTHGFSRTCCQNPPTSLRSPQACLGFPPPIYPASLIPSLGFGSTSLTGTEALSNAFQPAFATRHSTRFPTAPTQLTHAPTPFRSCHLHSIVRRTSFLIHSGSTTSTHTGAAGLPQFPTSTSPFLPPTPSSTELFQEKVNCMNL